MINISFIVPYPQLEKTVKEAFSIHPQRDILNQEITVISAENIDTFKLDCDVVVARGYTAEKLKRLYPYTPIIEIIINAYDIIKAVEECRKEFNPKKIGIIGAYSAINGASNLCSILDCDIRVYNPKNIEEVNCYMDRALKDGCDSLIGGFSVNKPAKSRGVNSSFIKTGKEAVEQALNEAIRTVNVMRQEREKSEILKAITQCSDVGIIYVGSDYRISEFNIKAQLMCMTSQITLYKTRIQDAFPFMENNIKDVIKSGKERSNELHKIGNIDVSANYIPVKVEKSVAGVVVNFQHVTKIQQTETQIRKKMNAKGLNAKYSLSNIIYSSQLMQDTIDKARKFANVSSNILLVGETGTGKELMAQSIHNESARKEGPFVAVNCAALPGIPVWADSVVILLIPIVSTLAIKTGSSMMSYGGALYMGALITASLVPPTPGPVAAAAFLKVPLGQAILWGLIVTIPGIIASVFYYKTLKTPVSPKEEFIKSAKEGDILKLPSTFLSITPIIVPLVLIMINTVVNTYMPKTFLAQLTAFVGSPLAAFLACASGALMFKHSNSSGFWVTTSMSNMTLPQGIISVGGGSTVAGFVCSLVTIILFYIGLV